MEKEMQSIKDAKTWKTIKPIHTINKSVKCRRVYTKKFDKLGNVSKYKARLVAKGYTQMYGIHYTETFSPVLKFKSLRVLIAIAASLNLEIYQDDVPSAFLRGTLDEEIYLNRPEGFKLRKKTKIEMFQRFRCHGFLCGG